MNIECSDAILILGALLRPICHYVQWYGYAQKIVEMRHWRDKGRREKRRLLWLTRQLVGDGQCSNDDGTSEFCIVPNLIRRFVMHRN